MKKRAIGKTVFLVLLALILLALLGYTAGLLYPRGARAGDNSGLGDWMGRLDGKLRLSEINIPGTHDSATQYIFPAYFLRDQDTGVQEQLENGYRYLDVRVALDKDGKELKLIHAFGTCRRGAALWSKALSYDDFCDAALAFLDAHPGETVIFCVKPENRGDDPAAVRALIEARAALEPDKWYTDNTIPTLDEARGRIVLCRRYDGALGLDFDWADQGDPSVLENPVEAHAMGETESLFVQDRYHYAVADKCPAQAFRSYTIAERPLEKLTVGLKPLKPSKDNLGKRNFGGLFQVCIVQECVMPKHEVVLALEVVVERARRKARLLNDCTYGDLLERLRLRKPT